jgi:hypothetical protein
MTTPSRSLVLKTAVIAAGLLLKTAVAQSQTLQRVDGLLVVDADGKTVGKALSDFKGGTIAEVAFSVGGQTFLLGVRRDGFNADLTVYFDAPDCVGGAYVDPLQIDEEPRMLEPPGIAPPGKTVYVRDVGTVPQPITPRSFSSSWTACTSAEANVATLAASISATDTVVPLVNVPQGFTLSSPPAGQPQGTVMIDDELISYQFVYGNDNSLRGVSRGVKGTQPAAHLAGASVVLFGFADLDASAARQLVDLDPLFRPPFSLTAAQSISAGCCCGDCNGNGAVTVDEILTSVNFALTGCPASSSSGQAR